MQNAYNTNMAKGLEGQLADFGPKRVQTRIAEGVIPFGQPLFVGTGPNQVRTAHAAAVEADFRGLALMTQSKEMTEAGVAQYADKEAVNNLTFGVAYVMAEEAVTPNDPVFVRIAAGAGGTVLGQFRNDADTATAIQLTRARFTESAAAGELVALEIALP